MTQSIITGRDLLDAGFEQGPEFGKALDTVRSLGLTPQQLPLWVEYNKAAPRGSQDREPPEAEREENLMEHFNKLTPAEAERLAMLSEECAEVIQIIGKILRHGYENHHPERPDVTNRTLLREEIGDVCAVLDLMDQDGFSEVRFEAACAKREKKLRFAHHQGEAIDAEHNDKVLAAVKVMREAGVEPRLAHECLKQARIQRWVDKL